MKFSIVTPSFNRARYFDDAIRSVVEQAGDFEIEYVVYDGASGDEVTDLLKRWEARVKAAGAAHACRHVEFRWVSEPDEGMYDAITKGFQSTDGDIMAWINTDDYYLPGAFQVVAKIFEQYPEIDWLSGIPAIANSSGVIVRFRDPFTIYNRRCLCLGYYHRLNRRYGYDWIQQDCVFWRRRLWDASGGFGMPLAKYAGDYFLWKRFALRAELVRVQAVLSVFRVHGDQITSCRDRYESEVEVPPTPSIGLLVYNQLRYLSGYYPVISRTPRLLKVLGTYLVLTAFQIPRSFLVGSGLTWSSDYGRWLWERQP